MAARATSWSTASAPTAPTRRGSSAASPHLFYRLFARFGEISLPEGAGDFRLIDRKGVEVLRTLGERARFSKGLYAWIGFKSDGRALRGRGAPARRAPNGASASSSASPSTASPRSRPCLCESGPISASLISICSIAIGALLHRPDAAVRHRPAGLSEPDRVGHVLLRHAAHVARHHRRICRAASSPR